jgi:peroxiredoxin
VIRSLGADLIAISPELPDNTLTMAEKHAIPIDILSDATSEVIKKYRLWFEVPAEVKALYLEKFGLNLEKFNGAGRWELPVPATYVLDRGGTVRAGESDPDYTGRMEPSDIVAAIRAIAGVGG